MKAGPGQPGDFASLPARGRVELTGYVESVTYPASGAAEVFRAGLVPDLAGPGSAHPRPRVELAWLGQRTVPGVKQGVWLKVTGMLTRMHGEATMHDPRYEIVAVEQEEA
ncbi:MAG: hypothetical protein ACTIJJ_03285 [Galactobacter sp.]